jgi:hypothetical protein
MAMVDSTHPEGLKLEKKVAQLTKVGTPWLFGAFELTSFVTVTPSVLVVTVCEVGDVRAYREGSLKAHTKVAAVHPWTTNELLLALRVRVCVCVCVCDCRWLSFLTREAKRLNEIEGSCPNVSVAYTHQYIDTSPVFDHHTTSHTRCTEPPSLRRVSHHGVRVWWPGVTEHEEELQMILGHARTRLDRFEQKLAEVGSPELLLDALTTKMRGVAQERVDKAVAQIRDQGNVREGEYVTNLRARTKELVAVQEQAAAMQQRIENAVAATAATTAKEIAAITAEHEKERIQLKADEVTLQGKIEALELKCATLRVRTEAAEAVKVQMGETATKLANARKAEESLRASASQATAQIAAKDSDLSAATTLVAELEKKLATTTALATSHASESARLSSMLDETTAAHVAVTDEHQRRISEHAEGIRARTSENERLSRELAETQEAHELDRECLRRELAEKEARHSETVNNLENDLHTIRTSTSATVNEAERESTLRESKLLQSLRNSKQETKRVHEELTASLAKVILAPRHALSCVRESHNVCLCTDFHGHYVLRRNRKACSNGTRCNCKSFETPGTVTAK